MKYKRLRLLLENIENNTVEYTYYTIVVSADGCNDETIEDDIQSFDEAKKLFDGVNPSNFSDDMDDATVYLNEVKMQYEYVGDEPISEYPIEEHYHDKDIYKPIGEPEYEYLEFRNVKSSRQLKEEEKEDNYNTIKKDTIDYIESISKVYKYAGYLDSTFYSLVPYKDGFIQIRIADHFFNIAHIHLGRSIIWSDLGDWESSEKYNIYGFLSIHLMNANDYYNYKKDKRGYIENFKYRYSESSNKYLIDFLSYSLDDKNSNYFDEEIRYDIENSLHTIKSEIDEVYSKGMYDTKDEDDDRYVEIEY